MQAGAATGARDEDYEAPNASPGTDGSPVGNAAPGVEGATPPAPVLSRDGEVNANLCSAVGLPEVQVHNDETVDVAPGPGIDA